MNFLVCIAPDEGVYFGGRFRFSFEIGVNFPHEAPKVKCQQCIFHPNIDLQGNVCLNILREDWKPVLSLNAVLIGLQYLFLEPNPDDPLNQDAAELLKANPTKFADIVRTTMAGRHVSNRSYDRVV